METQGDRFRIIRERLGLSKQEFARSLSIPPSLESVIESGQRRASLDVLYRLDSVHHVDLNWFISGSAETLIPDAPSDSVEIMHVLQEAAAGRGAEIEEWAERRTVSIPQTLVTGRNAAKLRAVTVRGDSMIDKEIYDRDIVVYDPSDNAGDCVSVVSLAGQLLVKHVAVDRLAGTVTLISANSVYPPRVIGRDETDSVKIEGKVIACLHRMG